VIQESGIRLVSGRTRKCDQHNSPSKNMKITNSRVCTKYVVEAVGNKYHVHCRQGYRYNNRRPIKGINYMSGIRYSESAVQTERLDWKLELGYCEGSKLSGSEKNGTVLENMLSKSLMSTVP